MRRLPLSGGGFEREGRGGLVLDGDPDLLVAHFNG